MRRSLALIAAAAWLGGAAPAGGQPSARPLDDLLGRLANRVEQYYSRARSIICTETVRIQPLNASLAPDGFARQLVYDLRVSWEPADDPASPPQPEFIRELRTVNGRAPKPDFEPGCLDPPAIVDEPLALLLPSRREKYQFDWAGDGQERRRPAFMVDYRSRRAEKAEVKWRDDCVSISLPGRTRGRMWVDPQTADVLRLDERLIGRFDFDVPREKAPFGDRFMEIERVDTTTRYRRVTFTDPDETVMLPESVVTLTIITGAGVPRLRTTQTYSDYRRFVTDARVVP